MKQFVYCFLLFFYFSCSLNKPSVSFITYKRVIIELDSGRLVEKLSLFLRFNDEDGTDDYESMTLIKKGEGFYWHVTRDSSYFFKSNEDSKSSFLVGTNKISYPFGKIPLGDYELLVSDMQGNKVRSFFSINDASNMTRLNAFLTINGERWEVEVKDESYYTYFYLLLLGADKQPIFLNKLSVNKNSNISETLESLKQSYPDARYIQLCAENSLRTQGFISKPLSIY